VRLDQCQTGGRSDSNRAGRQRHHDRRYKLERALAQQAQHLSTKDEG